MLNLFPWCMYFLSFTPLWIAVAFVNIRSLMSGATHCLTEIISITLIFLGTVFGLIVLHCCLNRAKSEEQPGYVIEKAREQKTTTADFILAYILPLLAFDFTRWDQTVLFLIFFITLGLLCIRHNYLILNVILDLLGYRFYECTYRNIDNREINRVVLSQQRLNAKVGLTIKLFSLNDDYSLDQYKKV